MDICLACALPCYIQIAYTTNWTGKGQNRMDETNFLNELGLDGKEEAERIKAAMVIYGEFNILPEFEEPEFVEPVYIEPTYKAQFGLETTAMLLSVAGSILVSAFTVGLILFITAINTDVNLAKTEGLSTTILWLLKASPILFFIAGMFSFEGYAFSHGFTKGKEAKNATFSPWALFASFTVMISAGLLRSFALVDLDTADPWLKVVYYLVQGIVVVSTGIGAPIIVFSGTENVGVFLGKFQDLIVRSKLEFDESRRIARQEWERERDESYTKYQDERNAWGRQFMLWYRKNAQQIFGVDRSIASSKRNDPEVVSEHDVGIQSAVKALLEELNISPQQVGIKPGNLISSAEIAKKLNLPNSNAVRLAVLRLKKA
jgi:hypothetical protein